METSFEVTTNLEIIHYVELYKYAYRKRIKWVLINGGLCVLCT